MAWYLVKHRDNFTFTFTFEKVATLYALCNPAAFQRIASSDSHVSGSVTNIFCDLKPFLHPFFAALILTYFSPYLLT